MNTEIGWEKIHDQKVFHNFGDGTSFTANDCSIIIICLILSFNFDATHGYVHKQYYAYIHVYEPYIASTIEPYPEWF